MLDILPIRGTIGRKNVDSESILLSYEKADQMPLLVCYCIVQSKKIPKKQKKAWKIRKKRRDLRGYTSCGKC